MSRDDLQLSVCHLGYRPDSPKTVTMVSRGTAQLPDVIPYYIRQNCFRMQRDTVQPEGFSSRFPAPYDLLRGKLIPKEGSFYYSGELIKKETRWGTVWQADFSDFTAPGSYQIETDFQVSAPFMIADWIYDRPVRGYLTFMDAQRCGYEVPGVHPACHLDDGVLDTDGSAWPATGGWHDAGDFRKWLALTQGNFEALALIAERGHPGFKQKALDEIRWGNLYFHRMQDEEGRVFEDVGGGGAPPGHNFTYEENWWFENHPGCYGDARDNRWTDNVPDSGDERMVRTTYNPQIQFSFVQMQLMCSRLLPGAEGALCRALAKKAWRYGHKRGHDRRTLFVAQELLAALEVHRSDPAMVSMDDLCLLIHELLDRQETGDTAVSGFFYEKDRADAYRSITYAGLPAWALLRLVELAPDGLAGEIESAGTSIALFCDRYLAADATTNPFSLVPYGVYVNQEQPDRQMFRDAGGGRGIRTFIHPFSSQGIVHGTGGVIAGHAAVLAKAAALLGRSDWKTLAEKQLQWTFGSNTLNRSLCNGIGYRQPVAYGFRVTQIPEGMVVGFIGRPDDTPYLEESFAIEWNTLEHWDVPYAWTVNAISWL